MEDSTRAGATAALAAPLPENPYTIHQSNPMTTATDFSALNVSTTNQNLSLPQTPDDSRYMDHFQASNVRGASEQQYTSGIDSAEAVAANILANGAGQAWHGESAGSPIFWFGDFDQAVNGNSNVDVHLQVLKRPTSDNDPDPQNMQGYAKLVFPDGDYFVTSHDLIVGRDMEYWRDLKRRQRAEQRAEKASYMYNQEPSQPGDGEQQLAQPSNSSQSLEGRPAPPNNYSERGGAVSYAAYSDGEAELKRARRKRRSQQFSKSSSTTSIAPHALHPNTLSDFTSANRSQDGVEPLIRTWAFLPVHPPKDGDILKISREHLKFSYNFQEERWELHIIGNRAFVNYELYEKGDRVALHHNDDIMVVALQMTFKLPDNNRNGSPGPSRGTFSMNSDAGDDLESNTAFSTSPIRRLSYAMEAGESKDEDEDELEVEQERIGRRRPKLKLKIKNDDKSMKQPMKQSKKKSYPAGRVDADKKSEKVKKPKAAVKGSTEGVKEEKTPSPVEQYQFEPGSLLASLRPDELPERRKGPGRPPKNGSISKRDEGLVKRRQKEYLKSGENPPSVKAILEELRDEETVKTALKKAQANGQILPDQMILQSIETDVQANTTKANNFSMTGGTGQTSTAPAEPPRRPSPRPKRVARSPSPMKPETECTEEELKKPAGTYVLILDEILREHPTGKADLSELYDRIMKKYPYYRYRVSTTGWQSSVRHNLLQNKRFVGDGRSGKGKLWTINWDVPMEKEKNRRRPSPPQRLNGQYVQGQMVKSMQYGNPYGVPGQQDGQPQFNAGPQNGAYYSPYAPSGQAGAGQMPLGPNEMPSYAQQQRPQPPSAYHQGQRNGAPVQQPSQQPAPVNPYQGLIDEIMEFRKTYLQPFVTTPAFDAKQEIFGKLTQTFSDLFHDGQDVSLAMDGLQTEEEIELALTLISMFKPWEQMATTQAINPASQRGNQREGATVGGGVQQASSAANGSGERSNVAFSASIGQGVATAAVAGSNSTNASPLAAPPFPGPSTNVVAQATGSSSRQALSAPAQGSGYEPGVSSGAKRDFDDGNGDGDADDGDARAKRMRV